MVPLAAVSMIKLQAQLTSNGGSLMHSGTSTPQQDRHKNADKTKPTLSLIEMLKELSLSLGLTHKL